MKGKDRVKKKEKAKITKEIRKEVTEFWSS